MRIEAVIREFEHKAQTTRRHLERLPDSTARRSFKHVRPAITLVAAPVRPATNPDHIQDGAFTAVPDGVVARIPRERAGHATPRPNPRSGY